MQTAPSDSRTRLLDAALVVIRTRGYAAARVEDICEAAGMTKGGFFHHFASKETLAVAAAEYWSSTTGAFFAGAPYHRHADPLDRVLGYLDFRRDLLRGSLPEYTCLAGTLVQETYDTHPVIRDACGQCISAHAAVVAADIAEAKRLHAPDATWTAGSLALHMQAVLQGAFVLAKAQDGPQVAVDCIDHLKRYVQLLFAHPSAKGSRP
jgi:TetR/AcrR family transcriptional regulator, transcriptional repressor for nem operon